MHIPGNEIYRCYDDWGPICVWEQPPYRYLVFGDGGEQSCLQPDDPTQPVHQYTQAMLLAPMLIDRPRSALVLGLGAGSLVNALLVLPDRLQVTAVELRPRVAQVAQQWFGFQPHPRVKLQIGDAGDFLADSEEGYDLLFADLYTDQGMDDQQTRPDFLLACRERLTPGGLLVLNLWDEGRGLDRHLKTTLDELFAGGCWRCAVEEGNLVVFAFTAAPGFNTRRLQRPVKQLGRLLGAPLHQRLPGLRAL